MKRVTGLPAAAWWLLCMALLATSAHAGTTTVRAFLDRTQAQLGDTVTLNVEVDGATQAVAPDASGLTSDFEILGRSHSTSINIVNGKRHDKTLWAIQLRPRHAGTIRIPSLEVAGKRTQPLTLHVGAAPTTTRGGPGDPVFMQVRPSTRTPYVGQQVALTVRLFYAADVNSGSIDMPSANGVEMRATGKTSRYQTQRGGRIYNVLEKHYALIARQAGSVNLAPVVFKGSTAEPGSLADFMGRGRPVTARSRPIRLEVRARPSSTDKQAWLPARKFSLALTGLPADGHVEAGQPLTLVLTEKAVGLPFESLPKLALPKIRGVDVYPDQATRKTDDSGRWLIGSRTRKFALVAQQPGQVKIPAITLTWWNVTTDKAEVATIPAHVLQVAAGQGAAATAPPTRTNGMSAAPAQAGSADQPVGAPVSLPPAHDRHLLAWVALGLWAVTMLLMAGFWWYRRRRSDAATPTTLPPAPAASADPRKQRQAFMQAARGGDVGAQCATLLAWARCERPGLAHLGALAEALQAGIQTEFIAELQRAHYAPGAHGPDAQALTAAFDKGFAWRDRTAPSSPGAALPPLYPQ